MGHRWKMPESIKGKNYKIVTDKDGNKTVATKLSYFNPSQVEIIWYDYEGNIVDSEYTKKQPSWLWIAKVPGIPEELIVSVEFPKINYTDDHGYKVKVYSAVLED